MNDAIETISYKGCVINIYRDTNPSDPRGDDNLGTMVCWHKGYKLGDGHDYADPEELLSSLSNLEGAEIDLRKIDSNLLDALNSRVIILPLYLYDHSGITMSTTSFNDRWDSGQVGFIYVTREKIQEEYGSFGIKTDEEIRGYLTGEVKEYDQYLTGQVYGFMAEDKDGNDIDSCWGFFGDYNEDTYMITEAKAAIDFYINKRIELHGKQVKAWIKNKVPVIYRKPLAI